MNATEELRALIEEHNVRWSDLGYANTCTAWESGGIVWNGLWRDGCIELLAHVTPKQAVDVTLGRGECHNNGFVDGSWYFVCSECGCEFDYTEFACEFKEGHGCDEPHFCPNCGRRVLKYVRKS